MATLRNKRKLAAVTRETQEENPRNGQSRNTSVPRINEEYITEVSEEIEGRVTKKLSQELSRTESRILGALSKLDEFPLNQQIRTHSGTVPETFRNTNVDNQGTNEDDSKSDPDPEAGLFRSQTTQNSGPEVGPYTLTLKISTGVVVFSKCSNRCRCYEGKPNKSYQPNATTPAPNSVNLVGGDICRRAASLQATLLQKTE